MSELVLVALITGGATVLTALINVRVGKKIDRYHKEVNGKMGELLVTTKALGNAEGKAEQKEKEKEKEK